MPGELKGLEYIHKHYGSLPWKVLIQPAIRIARDGFVVGEDMERSMIAALADTPSRFDFFSQDPSWALDFAPGGVRVSKGKRMTRTRYADTLEEIATHGSHTFYEGSVGQRITDFLNNSITEEDLHDYTVRSLRTANTTYRDHRIFSTVAPSSGTIVLSALKILEGFGDLFKPQKIHLSTHRLVEAMKFAFAQRSKLGDPDFVPGMDVFADQILSKTVTERIRNHIKDNSTLEMQEYNPDYEALPESHGTAHIVTTDQSGLSVSLTSTINLLFGSHMMEPHTGIIMNNVMNDFSLPGVPDEFGYAPSPANYVQPGKRPLSSTTPVFVEDLDGNLQLVIGAAGGSRIISSTIQSIVHVLDRDMTMLQALQQPRLHDQLIPNETGYEAGYDALAVSSLANRGHNMTLMPGTLSAVQGIIRRIDGTFDVASEPRQRDSGGFSF